MELETLHEHVVEIYRVLERNTVILEQNTKSLEDHIRRTNLLEEQMRSALLPVQLLRALGVLLGTLAAVAGIIQLFRS